MHGANMKIIDSATSNVDQAKLIYLNCIFILYIVHQLDNKVFNNALDVPNTRAFAFYNPERHTKHCKSKEKSIGTLLLILLLNCWFYEAQLDRPSGTLLEQVCRS